MLCIESNTFPVISLHSNKW